MKPIAKRLACAVIAAVAIAVAASPARAGLDFTDTATFKARSPDATFNGSSTIGSTVTVNNGFGGATALTISSAGTTIPQATATVDFSYTGIYGGVFGATYATSQGFPQQYTMVVEFGTIVGTATLTNITFVEAGSSLINPFSLNRVLTAADSNSKLFILIPTPPPAGGNNVALTERDLVQSVRLEFLFATGAGVSIGIKAVVNPEPATVALFGLGLIGLAGAVRSRRRSRARAQNA